MSTQGETITGAGIGLRLPHVPQVLASEQSLAPWFELLVDNWLVDGGLNRAMLTELAERYPLVLHGVGLSLGGMSPLDWDYLKQIRQLKEDTGAIWYSEHASFSGNAHLKIPDLLPLPYTQEAVIHLAGRIRQVQDYLGERILLENVSTYLSCKFNEMNEVEFLAAVAEEADCYLLLDINNVFVTCSNLATDPEAFMAQIPAARVKQIHLAGFENKGDYLLDAHNNPVDERVWQMFSSFIAEHGAIPSMIEWDNDLPSLERLLQERAQAALILDKYQNRLQDNIANQGGEQCA